MQKHRPKSERRRGAWCYQGNAQVVEVKLCHLGLELLKSPNRIMEKHRSSLRGTKVA